MGQRPTRRAGIAKFRVPDPSTQKVLDAIIERIEVLDGIRGDSLDQAVTYRGLGESGFTIIPGANDTPEIINTPGPGTSGPTDIPGIGVAAAPEGLVATETFLALLLTWNNPSFNLQHIEVWRSATDNLSLAILLGTTVAPQFADYVGANATYYYWVRSVGTDGTYSAYNAVAGTEGTTGVDPSDIQMDPGSFVLTDGSGNVTPFTVGTIDGEPAVALDGQFIVDGTIRAESIIANSIGADRIAAMQLSAISGDMGTLRLGRLTTGEDGNPPLYDDQSSFRVEIQDQAATAYPLWYGSGAKSDLGGLFYVDKNGRVVIKGILDASMIKQSFFAPAGVNQSFRIATEYVDDGTPGANYVGKQAHILPMRSVSFVNTSDNSDGTFGHSFTKISGNYTEEFSPAITFYGPQYAGTTEYGRLGSHSENILVSMTAQTSKRNSSDSNGNNFTGTLYYQYDNEGWKKAWYTAWEKDRSSSMANMQVFNSRETAWDALSFRMGILPTRANNDQKAAVSGMNLCVWIPNFGYADLVPEEQAADTRVDDLSTKFAPRWE